MQFLKNEWKAILVTLWLAVISILLVRIDDQLTQLQNNAAKIASTLDSVESVALSTDEGVSQTSQRIGDIDANVNFIVQKVRRR